MSDPIYMEPDQVPETVDTVEDTGPGPEWREGTYAGYDCMYREVTDPQGDHVLTKRGNKYLRPGDYEVTGLDEAPQGYGSETIARVVRKGDSKLSLTRNSEV